MTYIITTTTRLPGVGLSKPGHWGGLRFEDEASAREYALRDANARPYSVEIETGRRRK